MSVGTDNLSGAIVPISMGSTDGIAVGGAAIIAPTVTYVFPSAAGGPSLSGNYDLGVGAVVTFLVQMSAPVLVSGTPTLTLSDGGIATYVPAPPNAGAVSQLSFSYTVGANQNSAGLAVTAINLNGGTIADGSGNNLDTSAALPNLAIPVQIDTTAPTVTSVVGAATGRSAGAAVTITLNMSETVTVANGIPTLTLNDGGIATYFSGSGTDALTFHYTVGAGQNTANLAVTAISLGTATIQDAAGNNADTSGAVNQGATGLGLQIDTTAPTVADVVPFALGGPNLNGNYDLGVGAVVNLLVQMTAPVVVSGTPTLTLSDGATATYVSGSGTGALTFSHTVGAGEQSTNLAVTAVNLNGGSIADTAGNNLDTSAGLPNLAVPVQIDTTAPTVTTVLAAATGRTAGAAVSITLQMSEAVTVANGTPTLTLSDGGIATYFSGSGTNELTFHNTVSVGQTTDNLGVTALNLGTATIRDAAGNNADTSGAALLGAALSIPTTAPAITDVVDTFPGLDAGGNGDLGVGASVTFEVQMTVPMVVTGNPTLTLNDGGIATYVPGASGSTNLNFVYTVGTGQNAADLKITALNLNGGSIQDEAGNNLDTSGALNDLVNPVQIDTTASLIPVITSPALSDVGIPVIEGTAEAGDTVRVTVAGATYSTIATGDVWRVNLATAVPVSGVLALNDSGANSVSVTATDLSGNVSAPTVQTLTITLPTITGTLADQGVPNGTPVNLFADINLVDTTGDSNTLTVTPSAPGNGSFTSMSGGTVNSSGAYVVTGTPIALSLALWSLVYTPVLQPGVDVATTSFTISLGSGNPVDDVTSVVAVQQVLGLAAVPSSQVALSASPDGSSFAAAQPGMTNEAVVTNPVAGQTYAVPAGYQALFLGGTAGATLSDTVVGNAYLVANSGADSLIANAPNDVLVAGSGNDSVFAGAYASTVAAGSGSATVFGGTNGMQSIPGAGSLAFSAIVPTDLTGSNQTVSVGGSAATVTVSGSGDNVIGGAFSLNVTMSGAANTVQAGSGPTTVFSGGSGNLILGSAVFGPGLSQIFETGSSDTIQGGVNAMAVTATGAAQVSGGAGSLNFVGGSGVSSVSGGSGAIMVSAGTGGVEVQLNSSDTATVDSGTGAVTAFGASGGTINLTGGNGTDYLVAGSGSETLNASGSTSSDWLSVNTAAKTSSTLLIAGSGNDTLLAGAAQGSTTLTGGAGSDAFVFFRQTGGGAHDVITNFGGSDALYIEGYGAGSAAALQSAATVGANGVTLTLSDSTTITFSNLTDPTALSGRIQYG